MASPLVKRIREIEHLDAFDSFTWNGGDLRRLNVIYGWNGSGKTTISRMFSFLERGRIHLPDLASTEFTIAAATASVKKQDLSSHGLAVKVFNEDFVKENLAFDESRARKIVILGKENIETQHELAVLESEQSSKREEGNAVAGKLARLPKVDTILTDTAREVTKQFGNTPLANDEYYGRNYNRARVEAKLADGTITEENIKALILSSNQVDSYRDIVKKEREKVNLSFLELDETCSRVFTAANDLLHATVTVADIQTLKADEALRGWTETGYRLHKERHSGSCLFCLSPLEDGLLDRLGAFFTDELGRIKGSIDENVSRLETIRQDYELTNLDSGGLFPDIAEQYIKVRGEIQVETNALESAIEALSEKLREKRKNLHDPAVNVQGERYPAEAVTRFNAGISTLNGLVAQHNERVERSADELSRAAKAIEVHTIASTVSNKEYFQKRRDAKALEEIRDAVSGRLSELEPRIAAKRASLQSAYIAVERINAVLKEFFGEQQIYLEVSSATGGEVGYGLKSRGKDAKYLSEAEKSVLALIYFFIKLEEDGCDKSKCIIVVDDPVDSQDGVFLFRTFGLLKRQLSDTGQLILLTHNFDFFNLIRDWLVSTDDGKDSGLYLIALDKAGASRSVVVQDLPELLRKFKSEYQYLFCRLYQYSENIRPLEEPLVANIGRKVLEYFAGFKWSCKTNEQFTSLVLSRFVGDQDHLKRGTGDFIVKFLHEYSHGQDFTRPVSAPMLEAKATASNILTFIRLADIEHYKDLEDLCKR